MLLLAIDTCGPVGSVALARVSGEGSLLPLGSAELAGRTTAAELVPALGAMLGGAALGIAAVDAVVVVDGPGSFTGIRIALSTAKALAEATGRPLFAVSRLRVLRSLHGAASAVLDAGRGEFYYGSAEEERLLGREELVAFLVQADTVVCEQGVADVFERAQRVPAPSGADALRAALPDVLAGRSVEVCLLEARYLRREGLYRQQAAAPGAG